MCKCITEVPKLALEHLKETAAETGDQIETAKLDGVAFQFNTQGGADGLRAKTFNEIIYTVRVKRKNGSFSDPQKKKREMMHTFCPYCGEKYPE